MKEDHDEGLAYDLPRLLAKVDRRGAIRLLAGVSLLPSLLPLLGCGGGSSTSANSGTGDNSDGDAGSDAGSCAAIPEETAGPYPGDGSNGPNVLTTSGVVRSDIRSSFGSYNGTAAGVSLTVKLKLANSSGNCEALAGYAIYLWHCDRDGAYSLYGVTSQNYLRGVQETDDDGFVTFKTIFPAAYSGRWPHIHFEVYPALDSATAAGNKLRTSQLALPETTCNEVYATAGYEKSITNLAQSKLATDNVFSDGSGLQLAEVTGSVADGYVATLTVGIAI